MKKTLFQKLFFFLCFAQLSYTSSQEKKEIQAFLEKSCSIRNYLKALNDQFIHRNLPNKGLQSADTLNISRPVIHTIPTCSIESYSDIYTGTIMTTWHKLRFSPHSDSDFVCQRSIPNVRDNTFDPNFHAITAHLTFKTASGSECHTNTSAQAIVFSANSKPDDFNAIPGLKSLLTCMMSFPNLPASIQTEDFLISRAGNPGANIMLARHMLETFSPQCIYHGYRQTQPARNSWELLNLTKDE